MSSVPRGAAAVRDQPPNVRHNEGVTDTSPAPPSSGSPAPESPPPSRTGLLDPSEAERAAHARARGLEAPLIAGGRDPDPDAGLREDRTYGRLLLIMVAAIVAAGFVLGIVANLLTGG
jgi:hypothetical protein